MSVRRLSRPRLTYANVMSTVAAFIALGGTSYAVTKLPKNSVGTPQIKTGAVTGDKLAGGVAISGPRGPRGATGPAGAAGAAGAQGPAGGIGTAEGWQALPLVGGWTNFGSGYELGGFRKDAGGTVELRGVIKSTPAPTTGVVIATLPPGYRPGRVEVFTMNSGGTSDHARVDVGPDGTVQWIAGNASAGAYVSLSGIFFTPGVASTAGAGGATPTPPPGGGGSD